MIGVNFVLSVLIDALKSANTAAEELLYSSIQLYLGEAGLEFDFADIENPDTRILRGRIDEAMKARRGGLDMMYRERFREVLRGSFFRNPCRAAFYQCFRWGNYRIRVLFSYAPFLRSSASADSGAVPDSWKLLSDCGQEAF